MRKALWTIAAAATCLVTAKPAAAQQMVPPGQLYLGGMRVTCWNIPTWIGPLNDVARATPGWILLDPSLFQLPPVLQVFIYAHECGHHVEGLDEARADCWAIRTGRNQRWFTPQDFNWLIAYFINNPGDWTHAPGPERLRNLDACYRS